MNIDWYRVKHYNDIIWFWYSDLFMLVPYFVIFMYKVFNAFDYTVLKDPKYNFKLQWGDRAMTLISLYPFLYYTVDCIVKLGREEYNDVCHFSFYIHHISSLTFLPFTVVWAKHWPWWMVGPGMLHAFLLRFPTVKWLNYIYLFFTILCHYGVYQKPFTNVRPYDQMKWGLVCVEISCVLLWAFNCSNEITTHV